MKEGRLGMDEIQKPLKIIEALRTMYGVEEILDDDLIQDWRLHIDWGDGIQHSMMFDEFTDIRPTRSIESVSLTISYKKRRGKI